MATYDIEMRGDGTVDRVLKDRRGFVYDLRDVDEAVGRIREDLRRTKGSEVSVFLVEPDGYRTKLRT